MEEGHQTSLTIFVLYPLFYVWRVFRGSSGDCCFGDKQHVKKEIISLSNEVLL